MTEISLYYKFCKLLGHIPNRNNAHPVEPICEGSAHRIGCSQEGHPTFFIECSDVVASKDIHLELIEVLFNQDCNLAITTNGKEIAKRYCVVKLKSHKKDFIRYFLDVFALVLDKLPSLPSTLELRSEISKLVLLFNAATTFSPSTVQGLWAELLVIEQSSNPDYLIRAWHVSTNDKFDFNDGIDKIEVKSTNNCYRKHEFALEQLNPNEGSRLLIASIFVIKTGSGRNIFDLETSIIQKLNRTESVEKLKSLILKTLGENIDEAKDFCFDYSQAIDSLCYFDYKSIPSISTFNIPAGVSNVHFKSDLSNITPINLNLVEGELHKSISL